MQEPYGTKLEIGDLAYVEFVASGRGNNVRSGYGTKKPLLCSVPVGRVVQIVGGPRYAQDMTWWKVSIPFGCGKKEDVTGWTSEGTRQERWLRPIPPLPVVQGKCRAPLGTRLAMGARAYVHDPTGRELGNIVRAKPGLRGKRKGKIPAGETLRVVKGPVCKDGMAWWKVRREKGPALRGWTSEGKSGEGFYLVPVEVRRNHPEPISPRDGRPTFRGDVAVDPPEDTVCVFSPDGEVVTVLFSDMIVEAPEESGRPLARTVSIELPVNSRSVEVMAEQLVLGYVWSDERARGVATVQLADERDRQTWPRGSDEPIDYIVRAKVRAVPSFSVTLSVEIEPSSARGEAVMAIDLIELVLHPLHRAPVQSRG